VSRRRRDVPRGGDAHALKEVLDAVVTDAGLGVAVARARVLAAWPARVGAPIAAVTEARELGADGTLHVMVRTSQWMSELSFREAELVAAMNLEREGPPVRRIRWSLMR
jgi:predicted nucleic acid-binding Zn ribbon protein